jgi:hypothetical protein
MASAAARPGYDSEGEEHLEAEDFGRSHAATTSWDAPEIVREVRGAAASCVDVARSRFPYAIVWTPLPLITWFLPFIGHMGICDSRGVIYDFAGPYTIGIDQMAFAKPTRCVHLLEYDLHGQHGRMRVNVDIARHHSRRPRRSAAQWGYPSECFRAELHLSVWARF